MTKTKILIVEDEAVISMHIQNSLIKLGYEICGGVNSGQEAVRMASELKPDLILMDIILQGRMDGIEAAKIIKDTLGIPVVYMTGNADVQTITRARETSPHGYVLKPINVLHLFSTIDTVLHRNELETNLRESEEKFRGLVQSLQDIIIIMNSEGGIIFENSATEETLGYSLMGKNGFDIVHPDDLKTAMMAFGELVDKTNKHRPTMFRARHADGTWLYLDALGSNMLDNKSTPGILLVCRDVTQRVKVQAALRESEQRYHTLFDQSPVGVFMFDKNMVLTDCNERLVEIMRTSRDKLIGIDLTKLRNNTVVVPKALETLSGSIISYEGPYLTTSSNVTVWITLNGTPLHDEMGNVIGGMAVMRPRRS
jgi:PAS domain S-box-containing protein